MTCRKFVEITSREAAPVRAVRNVPSAGFPGKKAKFRSEDRQDVVPCRTKSLQDGIPVHRPVALALMVETTIVQHYIEAGRTKREPEGMLYLESDAWQSRRPRPLLRPSDRKWLGIDRDDLESHRRSCDRVPPFTAADVKHRAARYDAPQLFQEIDRIG